MRHLNHECQLPGLQWTHETGGRVRSSRDLHRFDHHTQTFETPISDMGKGRLGLIGRAGVCRCKGCWSVCPVFESLLFAVLRLFLFWERTFQISVDFVGICSAQPFVTEWCISAFRPKRKKPAIVENDSPRYGSAQVPEMVSRNVGGP